MPRGVAEARALALGCGLALLVQLLGGLPANARPVEFWVIEPNEGGSAGGHAALRIGETVHHVQRRPDGLLSDERTPRSAFERVYRGLGNRGIEVIPLALGPDEVEALRETLESRAFRRRRALDRLDALEASAEWLARTIERGAAEWRAPGLGLAVDRAGGCDAPEAARLASFRRSLAGRHDAGWLDGRVDAARRAVDERVRALLDGASTTEDGAHDRLLDAVTLHGALHAIARCAGPPTDRLRLVDPQGPVDPTGPARWRPIASALEARLLALVETPRADAGLAILLTAARWAAIERSIETGRLHAVATRAAEAHRPIRGGATDRIWRAWLEEQERAVDHAARALTDGAPPLEARFAALESALHHLAHGRSRTLHGPPIDDARRPRSRAHAFAAGPAPLSIPIDHDRGRWIARRDALVAQARDARRDARRALGYGLFTRNCVTELTTLLEDARDLPRDGDLFARLEDGLAFVPAVAARRIARHPAAGPIVGLPSARRDMVRAAATSGTIGERLRELSPLTSRTYRPHADDSSFLFFTRDTLWARPLLGVGNLVWATAATAAGVLSAPFDGAERLRRGGNGVLMSVPELFFASVRQGSYPIVPPSLATGPPPGKTAQRVGASGCGFPSACARAAR